MQNKIKNYINQHKLFDPDETVLLTVSGGVDSVVLLHLFVNNNYKIAVAHCNFNLRGSESDSDELFVKKLTEKYNLKSHFISFDTTEYAEKKKISIEMAARELRYSWFNKLLKKNNYSYIATGHHLNDSIETLFLNLVRGTGYSGVNGIAPKRDNVIRPLLFATRQQIEQYAQKYKLNYCVDATNESEQYIRNKIRKKIIPVFKEINPAFEQVMKNNFDNLNDATEILDNYFNKYRDKIYKKIKYPVEIPYTELVNKKPMSIHLFELINKFGFNRDAVVKISTGINKNVGALFYSNTHQLLIDRNVLIIRKINTIDNDNFIIKNISEFEKVPINFELSINDYNSFKLIKTKDTACLDADKVQFPITLRKWRHGDYFYPLGMRQRQKISDFLINNKVNRFDKENTWVLESGKKIIWLVNYRIDNRFKVDSETKKVMIVKYCK